MKIAIAGFQHETNTFSKIKTTYQDFVDSDYWPGMIFGDEITTVMRKKAIAISGFIDAALRENVELAPLMWCSATPSGIVEQKACDLIFTNILDRLSFTNDINAIYFDLHGSMVTEELQDSEGHFLRKVRNLYPNIPIVISVDFHANLSSQMVNYCDRIVVYRTYPHVDLYDIGKKAYSLLEKIVNSGTRPYKTFYKIPYLVPINAQSTSSEPCSYIYEHIINYESRHKIEIEYAMGFPLSDIKTVGPSVIIYSESQDMEIPLNYWKNYLLKQQSFFYCQYYSCYSAVKIAATTATLENKIILVDTQDNPGCGGTCDTTGLAQEMINQQLESSIIGLIYDPDSAKKAHNSGIGSTIELRIGAKEYMDCQPIVSNCQVISLSNGQFTAKGDFYSNMKMDLGPMALLKVGLVHIVLSSKKAQAADRTMFTHLGIKLDMYKVIALKSSIHYQADFKQLSDKHLVVVSPGINIADLKILTYHHKPESVVCI